ncbi:hypothetical protein V0288_19535 [Pannus brasiliensis CCIBt3594]|uniref:Uncharacterized protein n=1 Tax=Pannus brasiliensis CCIBt3594 TaxID=1427578 RepID=A0AAW9QZP4_9CHRO
MKVESIRQEQLDGTYETLTEVVFSGVDSLCILSRSMIRAIGRPGVDSDLEFLGSGDRWAMVWTYPRLSLEEVFGVIDGVLPARV